MPAIAGSLEAGNAGRPGGVPRRYGTMGTERVKKLAIAVALCGALISSPASAKTFVGVLWPMFGPLPAIGLVELVAELKAMPDVEVETYVHQAWPSLVDDLARQPPGTHTVVIGYSLGANSSVFVANNAKHVDLIIALQPSLLSWNPPLDPGKVGRMIEIYNPNPWMTFGGMGSRKLVGENIEYIENNDSHPGAQFDPQFRNLAKTEVAKFAADDRLETAQADKPAPVELAQSSGPSGFELTVEHPTQPQHNPASDDGRHMAQAETPKLPKPAKPELVAEALPTPPQRNPAPDSGRQVAQAQMPKLPNPAKPEQVAEAEPKEQLGDMAAFLEKLSSSVNSGDVLLQRRLTVDELRDFAKRRYRDSPTAGLTTTASN
jgi:hypothetical protein